MDLINLIQDRDKCWAGVNTRCFKFHKMLGTSWQVGELLGSQKHLCSIDFLIQNWYASHIYEVCVCPNFRYVCPLCLQDTELPHNSHETV
jgi:hypothetical protein